MYTNWYRTLLQALIKLTYYNSCLCPSFSSKFLIPTTDYGHPDRAFFQKFETFGLGQTNWAEILWGIWGISGQTISTILALWVPCPWESVAGSLSYKKLWFLGLKHTTPKYSQNKIWAVKNLGNNVRTSVFGGTDQGPLKISTEHFAQLISFYDITT